MSKLFRALLLLAIVAAGLGWTSDVRARSQTEVYIVQLKGNPVVAYGGELGLPATRPAKGEKIDPADPAVKDYVRHLTATHDSIVAAIGAEKVYSYRYTFNGFAARMTEEQAAALEKMRDVVHVWQDELMQPQTDSTPRFLGLSGSNGLWNTEDLLGEDVVIGIIDTGIWPEHPSFADTGCDDAYPKGHFWGHWKKHHRRCGAYEYDPWVKKRDLDEEQWKAAKYDAAPESFTSSGCDFGNSGFNAADAPFECNDKLLAARYYAGGFSSPGTTNPDGSGGNGAFLIPSEYLSARDQDGHGSHTGSTAAGNLQVPASIAGQSLGRVSGMAPRARVAVYKVCWNGTVPPPPFQGGCFSSDSMAAIDQAVADGVDVINFSIGGSGTNFNGPDDIAFLFAAAAGVFVATSNGNDGPGAQTVGTPAGVPWITAVGASQDNKVFNPGLEVTAPGPVAGIYEGLEGAGPVTIADAGTISGNLVPAVPANGCSALTNGAAISGNIALVIRGVCGFDAKYLSAQAAGATAIVVYNDGTAPDRIDPIAMGGISTGVTIPGMMIGFNDGVSLAGAAGVTATLDPDVLVSKKNTVAGFSSRGPNGGAPDIIKPDVAAPGVNILAAQTPTPNDGQTPGQLFQIISGTSMASPHVAGVAALIKQEHPDWTPAMVRSALMTTARRNINETFGDDRADPFDIGAGQIQPKKALEPGIVYDAGILNYAAFTCGASGQPPIFVPAVCDFVESLGYPLDSSDLNLPSIAVAALAGQQTVTRTVTSVAEGRMTWKVDVQQPPGVQVSVSPRVLTLREGESATYRVTFTTKGAPFNEWAFGSLTWVGTRASHRHRGWCEHGGDHKIRAQSPIAVKPVEFAAPAEVAGSGVEGSLSFDVSFGYTGAYTAGTHGLDEAETQDDTVTDDPANDVNAALGTCDFGAAFPWPCTGLTWHAVFLPPDTDAFVRVSLFDEETDGNDDLDLYVFDSSFNFVGGSGNSGSNEQVDIPLPADDLYFVAVHGYQTDGPDANYTLSSWGFGLTDDRGNMTVAAPGSATLGAQTITVDWAGLNAGTRYLGAVSHSGDAGLLGLTLVKVETK